MFRLTVLSSLLLLGLHSLAGAADKSIIIGEAVRAAMYAPLYVAEEKGFFKKHQLETKIVTFAGGNTINSLVAGEIQFAALAPDSVIRSSIAGFPAKLIMGLVQGLNLALAVRPEIKSGADLRGKTIGISDFSGLPYTALLLSLKELGLKKEEITYLKTGGKSLRYQSLLAKRVDGAVLDPPFTTMAQQQGLNLLVDLSRLDVPYLRSAIAVSDKKVAQDRSTVTAFVTALSEAIQFYKNPRNSEDSMRILAKYLRLPLDKNRGMIEEGYTTYRDMTKVKPYADPRDLKMIFESLAESNPKAKNVAPASVVDNSFVERLDKEGVFGTK